MFPCLGLCFSLSFFFCLLGSFVSLSSFCVSDCLFANLLVRFVGLSCPLFVNLLVLFMCHLNFFLCFLFLFMRLFFSYSCLLFLFIYVSSYSFCAFLLSFYELLCFFFSFFFLTKKSSLPQVGRSPSRKCPWPRCFLHFRCHSQRQSFQQSFRRRSDSERKRRSIFQRPGCPFLHSPPQQQRWSLRQLQQRFHLQVVRRDGGPAVRRPDGRRRQFELSSSRSPPSTSFAQGIRRRRRGRRKKRAGRR